MTRPAHSLAVAALALCLAVPLAVAAQRPLDIVRITPSGVDVPAAEQIVFQFNRPVVPVGRMARDAAEIPIAITPDPGCDWRWLDTSALACRLREGAALLPATRYRVVVSAGLEAEDGGTLATPRVHEFTTIRPRIAYSNFETWSAPGKPHVRVVFNQPVDADSVARHLSMRAGNRPAHELEVEPRGDEGKVFAVTPRELLPGDTLVSLSVEPGVRSQLGVERGVEERVVVVFRTFPEPRFLGVRCTDLDDERLFLSVDELADGERLCDPQRAVYLHFSSPVTKEVLRDHLEVTPDPAGGRDDYDPWEGVRSRSRLNSAGRSHDYGVRLPAPLAAARDYSLAAAAADIRDEFDRPLLEDIDFRFATDHRRPRLVHDRETSVLESRVPTHLPVVVTNLSEIDVELATLGAGDLGLPRLETIPVPAVEDVAFHLPIRVRDWLPKGSGAVVGKLRPTPSAAGDFWFFSQVTPFQVHLKVGHHNTLAWVTDLATGEAVAGAEVRLERRVLETLAPALEAPDDTASWVLGTAVTGDDGIAELAGAAELDPQRTLTDYWLSRSTPHLVVRVIKDGEVALLPAAHDFRVDSLGPNARWLPSYPAPRYGHLRAWGFTAQGIYRAGDRIEYKIFVRQEGNRRLEPAPADGYRLKVVDPTGRPVHERRLIELNDFGAFAGDFKVPASGAVGWYNFELSAEFAEGRSWWPLEVLVTDFTPAPFRVSTDLNGELFRPGDRLAVNTSAALFAGGPYARAATRVTTTLTATPFVSRAPRAEGFHFGSQSGSAVTLDSQEALLDERGELDLEVALQPRAELYGRLLVESAVRDDRGKRVAGRATATWAGRDRYVGIRQPDWLLQAGEEARLEALVTDAEGALVAGTPIRVLVEQRKTVASRVKGAGNAYLTRYSHSWEEAATCDLVSADEPVTCVFVPAAPGGYRMTASIEDTAERPVSVELERWAIGRGQVLWEESAGHHLQIEPEKETLRVGETARFLVKNPFPGARALVTIERYGVIDRWFTTLEDSTSVLEFPVEADYLPGFYLSVVVNSPRVAPPPEDGEVDLGKPSFRMGYVRVPVKDPHKELIVEVTPQRELYKPRETAVIDIHTSTRQQDAPEIELAVAVLDESVLELIARGTEVYDPYVGLYDFGSLDVANYSLIKQLVGWQEFEKKGANPGGGGGPDASVRSLFKFVSYWNPSLRPDAEGRARVEFELPDNLTAWRVLVVAVTAEDRLGLGQASFKVNRDTEIRPALPNQVIEGDRFEARFTVMNRTAKTRTLKIRGVAGGAVEGSPRLKTKIRAAPYERYAVSLPVAAAAPGEVLFTLTAGDRADADALEARVPVRRREATETAATYGTTTDDKVVESLLFPAGMRTDTGRVSLVVTPTVIGSLEGAFAYIRDYPYGCWEQRLSKGVMAAHFRALRDYLDPALEWPESGALPAETLERAGDFQAPNGGMAYWVPRDRYVSPYLSAYTALAFHWLRDLGYEVPAGVETRLHEYLERLLRRDDLPDFYSRGMASSVRAVALAALAESERVTRADVERYRRHLMEMDLFGKAHFLRALDRVGGDAEERAATTDLILGHANESGGKVVFSETLDDGYQRLLHSDLRTSCALLSTFAGRDDSELAAAGVDRLPFKLVRTITQSRGNRLHWENTQENMFCTRALIDYSRRYEQVSPRMEVGVRVGGEALGSGRLDDLRSPPLDFERPLRASDPGQRAEVEIERAGEGRLYYALRLFYSPTALERRRIDAGMEARREYSVERDGKWVKLEEPLRVRQGELVRVDLYLHLPAARNFVVVDDPVPGGLEPVNRDLATASTVDADKAVDSFPPDAWYRRHDDWVHYGWSRWSFYHRELRHDSARFYSDYLPAGNYHLSYVAQVIAPGRFAIPPLHVEEMYDPDVFGQGLPGTLEAAGLDE